MEEKNFNTASKNGLNPEETGINLNSDENVAGINRLDDEMTEENEEDEVKIQLQEQKDKFVRLFAEFDNFKKRNARERVELIQTAGKEVIVSMLAVLDDCDRAEKQIPKEWAGMPATEGIQLVFNKLRTALLQKGLKEMKSLGESFNPDLHEAITEIPAGDPAMVGKVVDVLEKGYFLNDKIIRFAKVVVGK